MQSYSGPASPYWAAKGFLGLLMPPEHPVWTAVEEPLPVEKADAAAVLRPPNILIQSTASDGLVRLHNHGSNHVGAEEDPCYARFAYSTRTGPVSAGVRDNHFGLVLDDGTVTARGPAEPVGHGPGWAASATRPLPGVRIVSATLVHGRAEVRAHLVDGAPPGTRVRQTGWAVTRSCETGQLHAVEGYEPHARVVAAGSTLFGPRSHVAVLDGTTGDGPSVFVALASLTGEKCPAPLSDLVKQIRVEGHTVRVTWSDGTASELPLDADDPSAGSNRLTAGRTCGQSGT